MAVKYFLFPGILFSIQSLLYSQSCYDTVMPGSDFKAIVQSAHTEVGWYKEWLDHTGGKKILPVSLPRQEKLRHSFMKAGKRFSTIRPEGRIPIFPGMTAFTFRVQITMSCGFRSWETDF
jgi:hypothetical protein